MDLKAIAMGVSVSVAVVVYIGAVNTGVAKRGPGCPSCFMFGNISNSYLECSHNAAHIIMDCAFIW